MIKYLKPKKNILMILASAVVILGIIILIVVLVSNKKPKDNPKSDEREIKNTVEKLEKGKITVTDFKITYNKVDEHWYLSMSIKNTSDKEIDLKDYSLKLYRDKQILAVLNGTTLGTIPAKTETGSVIALGENYDDVNYIEIVKE